MKMSFVVLKPQGERLSISNFTLINEKFTEFTDRFHLALMNKGYKLFAKLT